jgi:peptide/nickel transport system substrate-binding protein
MRVTRRDLLAAMAATTAPVAGLMPLEAHAQAQGGEKVLLMLGDGVPASLDVDGSSGSHNPTQTGVYNLLEPLVQYDFDRVNEDGAQLLDLKKFAPALAESWSFDEKTLTWTFKLRRGAKSPAGNEFTADDVLYSFARGKSLSGAAPLGYFQMSLASVKNYTPALFARTPEALEARKLSDDIQKVDDYTVTFTQSSPNPLLLTVLPIMNVMIYDSKEMLKNATPDDPWSHNYTNNVNGPSFGPWKLESWRKEQEFIVTRNPGYYGPRPYYDRIIFRRVPQSSNRIAILRSGQAQLVEGLNPKEFDSLQNARGVKVTGGYLNSTLFMTMNYKVKPFDNIKLRQAIAYAMPYEDIIRTSYFNQAKRWQGLIPSSYPGYKPVNADYGYKPEEARRLLAEAGYPEGKGLEAFPEAFKLGYMAEREGILGSAATLIQTRFRQLGIPVQLDPLPAVQFADRQMVKKDMPFSIYDTSKPIGVDTLYAINLYYVTPPLGVVNMSNYSNQRVDEIFRAARTEMDEAKRQALLDEAQTILSQELPHVPILENKLQYAVRDGVKGVVIHPCQVVLWRFLTAA